MTFIEEVRPARDVDPGWSVWINHVWREVDFGVLVRRSDGSEKVTLYDADGLEIEEWLADDLVTVRRKK